MREDLQQLKQSGFTLVEESLPIPNTLCVLATPAARTFGILTSEGKWRFMDPGLGDEVVLAWKTVQN